MAFEKNPLGIKPGDVWQVGDHTFICGDIFEVGGLIEKYIPQVDTVYTDPPWNPSAMKLFYTFAKQELYQEYMSLLDKLITLTKQKCPQGKIYFDMSATWVDTFLLKLKNQGATILGRQISHYYSERWRPCHLLCVSFSGGKRVAIPPNLKGQAEIEWVAEDLCLEGKTFFDPMAGKLNFVIAAIKRGATTYGVELIPGKLGRGLLMVGKLLGIEPHKIDPH